MLEPEESALAKRVFGLTQPANFEGKHWHLYLAEAPEAAAAALGIEPSRAGELLESARRKLLAARERRVWPGRDEKLLVSWNGLMIGGMARAARVLDRPELAESATRAVDFIRAELWQDGRLKATYKDGRARFAAYLDDYAFLAHGLLELLQCRWRDSDLEFARELADVLLEHFEDPRGGFFFTADDHERLIHKPKPFIDEAVPAGNGVAALALLALGHLLGEQRYLDAAERTVRAALHTLERYPDAHATLLRALEELLAPPKLVVLRGTPEELAPWRRKLAQSLRAAPARIRDSERREALGIARAARAARDGRRLRLRRDDLPRARRAHGRRHALARRRLGEALSVSRIRLARHEVDGARSRPRTRAGRPRACRLRCAARRSAGAAPC